MQPRDSRAGHSTRGAAWFATTHWSVVLAAGDANSPETAEALDHLCRTYWPPLFAYIRRLGHSPEQAKDLAQEFFVLLIERRDLENVRREKGRFRSYLLVALKHFLANEWKWSQRQKRGGGLRIIPIDSVLAEDSGAPVLADMQSPDRIFERHWARTLLDRVLDRLEQEYASSGKSRQFACLRSYLSDDPSPRPQGEIARELGASEGAVKQAVHRMRRRYRELLREEVAHTVAAAGDVEDELRHLIAVLRG